MVQGIAAVSLAVPGTPRGGHLHVSARPWKDAFTKRRLWRSLLSKANPPSSGDRGCHNAQQTEEGGNANCTDYVLRPVKVVPTHSRIPQLLRVRQLRDHSKQCPTGHKRDDGIGFGAGEGEHCDNRRYASEADHGQCQHHFRRTLVVVCNHADVQRSRGHNPATVEREGCAQKPIFGSGHLFKKIQSQNAHHERDQDACHADHGPNHDLLREEESPSTLEEACAQPPWRYGFHQHAPTIGREHLRHSKDALPNEDGAPDGESKS
mmetsp:Transcript_43553/g.60468  ORF Transcript_43553/g.60468 Transcript_43553/m.60468 type:complete len:264 (-) Transcript_43553:214-1005(-)